MTLFFSTKKIIVIELQTYKNLLEKNDTNKRLLTNYDLKFVMKHQNTNLKRTLKRCKAGKIYIYITRFRGKY